MKSGSFYDPAPITRDEAEAALRTGDADAICDVLVRIAYHEADAEWTQQQCLAFVRHSDAGIRATAVTCLGHLARIHHRLDLPAVVPTLDALRSDDDLSGRVDDALSDIRMF